jgi:hypothetical protein
LEADLMSEWIELTDDPATLPVMARTVIIRMDAGNGGGEMFGWRDGRFPEGWCWYQSKLAYWHSISQSIEPASCEIGGYPTHWRPI